MKINHLNRRKFLCGLGVTMAIPWMESFSVWGSETTGKSNYKNEAPLRLGVIFSGNGFHSKEWGAKGNGKQM